MVVRDRPLYVRTVPQNMNARTIPDKWEDSDRAEDVRKYIRKRHEGADLPPLALPADLDGVVP